MPLLLRLKKEQRHPKYLKASDTLAAPLKALMTKGVPNNLRQAL